MAEEPKTLTSLAELGEVARPDADIEPEPQIDRLGPHLRDRQAQGRRGARVAAAGYRDDHGQQAPRSRLTLHGLRSG